MVVGAAFDHLEETRLELLGDGTPLARADRSESAPVIHLGIGRVQALTDSSLFYEVNPGLLIGEESVDLLLPIRIGLIFR